jgi:hypothetical protein
MSALPTVGVAGYVPVVPLNRCNHHVHLHGLHGSGMHAHAV